MMLCGIACCFQIVRAKMYDRFIQRTWNEPMARSEWK